MIADTERGDNVSAIATRRCPLIKLVKIHLETPNLNSLDF